MMLGEPPKDYKTFIQEVQNDQTAPSVGVLYHLQALEFYVSVICWFVSESIRRDILIWLQVILARFWFVNLPILEA